MANKTNSAWTGVFWASMVLSPLADASGQAVPSLASPKVVHTRPSGLVIDGNLREWTKDGTFHLRKIDKARSIWNQAKRRKWGGVDDFSADLWIASDTSHLYLAGIVRDDHHVPVREGEDLETGDSIEVFLDVKLAEDSEDATASRRLGKEDVQLFLLPLAGKSFRRPWDRGTPGARPTGLGLEGVKLVASRSDPKAKTYTFEASIPIHNFLPLADGRAFDRLGFHLAFNDRDPGSDVVHYATLDGENPTLGTGGFMELKFRPPLLSTYNSGIGFDERLAEFLPWGLVGLLVLTTIFFFSRRAPLVHLATVPARFVRVLGVVLLLVGLFLPVWLTNQKSVREQRLESAVATLEGELMPRMEEGTLTSYVGAARDRPLLDLLQGQPIKRKQSLSYQFLSEMAAKQFGTRPREYPEEGFRVRPYWLPLPAEQPQSFSWKKPLEQGNLYLVVSPVALGLLDESPLPTLLLTYRLRDGNEVVHNLDLATGVALVSCAVFGEPDRDMTYVSDVIPEGASSLSLTARGEVKIELIGMTLVPINPDSEPRPLVLGQALGEIETDLRGVHPKDAGFELQDEVEVRRIEIPRGRVRAFDKLWLVYSAAYPVLTSTEPPKGEEVCKVVIHFAKGEDKVITLTHQESMFYEQSSRNSEDVTEGLPAVQAEVGGVEDEDKRINVVYRVDLRRDALVQRLEFRGMGLYPVRFRSVIFGYERSIAPPEPSNSPLVAAAPGQVKLRADILAAIQGNRVAVYRNGSLVESDLVDTERERHAELPAAVHGSLSHAPGETVKGFLDVGGTRVFRRFIPLGEESGAVLGVFGMDEGFGDRQRLSKLMRMVLCLLSIPFLLLLFNDALAWLSNLRLRLMAVVSVAAVVPMAVMFILLARTLESDHEEALQRNLQQAVRAASDLLHDRQDKLLESAVSHIAYLRQVEEEFRAESEQDVNKLKARLESAMSSQRGWRGGFMKLEYTPGPNAPDWLTAFTSFDSESDTRLDTPLRVVPGFYLNQEPFLGVRIEDGPMSLSLARPLDRDLLGEISASKPAVLCTTSGYPLMVSGDQPSLMNVGYEPDLMRDRARVRLAARDSREPVFQRHRIGGSWIAAYDVLRDPQDNPRAILGGLQRDEAAKLTLADERVPVRTFFVVIAGLLLVLSLALASIVTGRITDPIERLEEGAEALRRGEFDVCVESQEGGQIGRLTETFNNMAQELRSRIQDLNHLNRGIQELTSGLHLDQVLKSAVAFFSRHSAADRVRVVLLDWERDRAEIFGEDRQEVDRQAPDVATVLSATGPLSMKLSPGLDGGVFATLFLGYHSMLVLPLVIAGRSRGGILLLFESPHPATVNLELLSTIAGQTSAALENARLYHHAVEDLYTGAFVPDYFSRLVGRAVANSQDAGESVSLIGFRLVHGHQQEEALGAEGYGRYMERIASLLRRHVSTEAKICRSSSDSFQVLLPDVGRDEATDAVEDLSRRLVESDLGVRGTADLEVACATFPAEGASAEFLFHALESKMSGGLLGPVVASTQQGADAGIVFSSPVMNEVVRVVQKVAPSELTILLDGETGTGKEVLANHIHQWSKRAKGPLVKVHCAALSESLLQSELFGHEKGAFTGATERRIGKFEQAEGGTIFLDEIGEVSLDTQVKLLRVLQEREVDRVGGRSPVAVDVRVIAATNRNIEAMVADGTFREDLYYRLQGMVVTVPPLRERKSEIPALLEVFRREAVAAGHTSVRGFSTDAMDEIFRRDWPGNIRELRNAAFRAMVLAGEGLMERSHLQGILTQVDVAPQPTMLRAPVEIPADRPAGDPAGTADGDSIGDAGNGAPGLPELVLPRSGLSLGSRLQTLYELVCERGSLSNQEYVAVAGVSSRTGLRDLNDLLARGLIERVGRRRGARYRARCRPENAPVADGE